MKGRNLLQSRKLFTFLVIFSLFLTMTVFGGTKIVAGKEQAVESIEIKSVGPSPGEDLTANVADNNITELSFWDDNYGDISDLFVVDNKMYLALGSQGFRVYDITDLNIQFVTSWDLYSCYNIYAEDDLVFVSNITGFNVVDISDTTNPELVCNWNDPGGAFDISAHGNYVYLAGTDEFKVVNITDRNNPVNYYNFTAEIIDMHYVDGYLYVADDIASLARCFNVTDPLSISSLDTLNHPGLKHVFYSENFVYYTTSYTARVGNATEKDNLSFLSSFAFNDTGFDIGVRNNHLFVNEKDRLEVFDCTNKTNPTYTYEYTDGEIGYYSFNIYENYAFAYNDYAVEILEISDPTNITSVHLEIFNGYTSNIVLDGDFAFVADRTSLEILDIADPTNPTKVGFYHDSDGGLIVDLFVRNGYVYILEQDVGDSILVILNIADPANPIYEGNISFTGQSMDIYVDDDFAYVAQAWNGLAIIDIYYPDYPMKSLQYNELGWIWGVNKIGDNLILAAEDYMHVVDVTNPYNPEQIGNYTRPNAWYWGVEIQNNYGFFVCIEGFDIIDLSNLLEPVKVGQFFTYENPDTLKVDGQYVYLLDANLGLLICDTENIVHPRLIGQYDDLAVTHCSLDVRKGYIFLAEGDDGTRILISDPLLYTVEDSPFSLISFVGGFVLFSVIGLLVRKKRKK